MFAQQVNDVAQLHPAAQVALVVMPVVGLVVIFCFYVYMATRGRR